MNYKNILCFMLCSATPYMTEMTKTVHIREEISCFVLVQLGKHLTVNTQSNTGFPTSVAAAEVLSTEPKRTHCVVSVCPCHSVVWAQWPPCSPESQPAASSSTHRLHTMSLQHTHTHAHYIHSSPFFCRTWGRNPKWPCHSNPLPHMYRPPAFTPIKRRSGV